jgi:hypothetical protein
MAAIALSLPLHTNHSGNIVQIKRVLGSVVAVAFHITFCAEMHANDFFFKKKIIFDISTSK